jgi:hypothetical protein
VAGAPPRFAVADELHGRAFSLSDAAELYPVRGNSVVVEEFDYDVSSVCSRRIDSLRTPLGHAERFVPQAGGFRLTLAAPVRRRRHR